MTFIYLSRQPVGTLAEHTTAQPLQGNQVCIIFQATLPQRLLVIHLRATEGLQLMS